MVSVIADVNWLSDERVIVAVETDDAVMEVDSSRRQMNDTYIGIVVGVLVVVILLIVVISVVIGVRLRRRKYSGSGASPSKFVFASSSFRQADVDYAQTLPLGAVRLTHSLSRFDKVSRPYLLSNNEFRILYENIRDMIAVTVNCLTAW